MKVTDALEQAGRPVFITDFTPPRGADPSLLDGAAHLRGADFVSVAYNPGKLVRLDSATAAWQLKQRFGVDVVFNLSPRDMNKIALQSRLLGAAAMGLENVLVLQGDPIAQRDGVTGVRDYTATGLIGAVRELNEGKDYRGSNLRSACDFCIGAALDLNRDLQAEVRLARRKVEAGAQFFVAQPVFGAEPIDAFRQAYEAEAGEPPVPVFWGVQVMAKDGVLFAGVPDAVRQQVERGRDGVEIALEVYHALREHGENAFYVVSPIMRGGARDYEAAARFFEAARA